MIMVNDASISPLAKDKNLGVSLDASLFLIPHIKPVFKFC